MPMVAPLATGPVCPNDNSLFLDHVKFVQNGWNPDPMNPAGPPPQLPTGPVANTGFASLLISAFQLAPPAFQIRLCKLDSIFVNGAPCNDFGSCMASSWGYRASVDKSTHIAISAGLWGLTCPEGIQANPYPYHCFESDLLKALLDQLAWSSSGGAPPPQYAANPDADSTGMTILAALAHEVGHVRWYELMNRDNATGGGTQAKHRAARRPAERINALRIIKILPGVASAWEPRVYNRCDQLCSSVSTASSRFLADLNDLAATAPGPVFWP
jgi:hypothetical protein